MQRTCAKCGFVNESADPSATAACPQCGAIYSKASAAAALQRQGDAIRNRVGSAGRTQSAARAAPSTVERIAWIAALICGAVALWQLIYTEAYAESAPQQAAGAALAAAWAMIPYCIARAIQLFSR